MIVYTNLMQKIFSNNADASFVDAISDKIQEARENGTATFSDGTFDLVFAEVDGDVAIEDRLASEVTMVSKDPETGEDSMYSATEPDVDSPRSKGEDGKGNEKPSSTLPDVNSPDDVGITDKDKAGKDKHYSVSFDGFDSLDDATEFRDQILTFSEDELQAVANNAAELDNLAAQVIAYSDLEDALTLSEACDEIRNYCVMAEQMAGHDTTDLINNVNYYSEVADAVISKHQMNESVTEFFSDFTEDELTDYFSDLDEDVVDMLFSAMDYEEETGDVVTFSDVNDALQNQYEMEEPISTVFSDMTEDDLTEFFSDLTQAEAVVMGNALENADSVSFSDVNEELVNLNEPLVSVFSDYTEDELNEYLSQFSDNEQELAVDIFSEAMNDETITYSDFLEEMDNYAIQQMTFSDEDVEAVADNATEIKKAGEVLEKNPNDVELAKKVKVLADKTIEDAEEAEEAGHDTGEVKKMCAEYSELCGEICKKHGVAVPSEGKVVENVIKEEDVTDEVKKTEEGKQEKAFSLFTGTGEGFNPKLKIENDAEGEQRVFADTKETAVVSSNPCFTSKFN